MTQRQELPLNRLLTLKYWPFLFLLSLTMLKICHFFLGLVPRPRVSGPTFQPRSMIHFAACDSCVVQMWVTALSSTVPPLLFPQPSAKEPYHRWRLLYLSPTIISLELPQWNCCVRLVLYYNIFLSFWTFKQTVTWKFESFTFQVF